MKNFLVYRAKKWKFYFFSFLFCLAVVVVNVVLINTKQESNTTLGAIVNNVKIFSPVMLLLVVPFLTTIEGWYFIGKFTSEEDSFIDDLVEERNKALGAFRDYILSIIFIAFYVFSIYILNTFVLAIKISDWSANGKVLSSNLLMSTVAIMIWLPFSVIVVAIFKGKKTVIIVSILFFLASISISLVSSFFFSKGYEDKDIVLNFNEAQEGGQSKTRSILYKDFVENTSLQSSEFYNKYYDGVNDDEEFLAATNNLLEFNSIKGVVFITKNESVVVIDEIDENLTEREMVDYFFEDDEVDRLFQYFMFSPIFNSELKEYVEFFKERPSDFEHYRDMFSIQHLKRIDFTYVPDDIYRSWNVNDKGFYTSFDANEPFLNEVSIKIMKELFLYMFYRTSYFKNTLLIEIINSILEKSSNDLNTIKIIDDWNFMGKTITEEGVTYTPNELFEKKVSVIYNNMKLENSTVDDSSYNSIRNSEKTEYFANALNISTYFDKLALSLLDEKDLEINQKQVTLGRYTLYNQSFLRKVNFVEDEQGRKWGGFDFRLNDYLKIIMPFLFSIMAILNSCALAATILVSRENTEDVGLEELSQKLIALRKQI
ncbi:hypothetical protein SCHIN_v1c10450 [Spiroplasma chinense]|uniref:Uncharacterized protein n=1 Tax=Spiroplasma chinense TaxID=216932 RepID=A0A5B9Y4Z3_9MOLU|nr:hypothetical protein [Spiroplasma chinense]QEH62238.1 hypothetical protein SCHIN_v1c10450 [Spiroplasma chinense]